MHSVLPATVFVAALVLSGCQVEPTPDASDGSPSQTTEERRIELSRLDERPTERDLEAARTDRTWREYVERNGFDASGQTAAGSDADTAAATSRILIGAEDGPPDPFRARTAVRADTALYADSLAVPLGGDAPGRAVLYAQILLDRAGFSPGQIDGLWGQNTEKAIFWLQRRAGLDATGTLDAPTLARLLTAAAAPPSPAELLRRHTLTGDEVAGPFRPTPDDVMEMAKLDALPYESLAEALGERFHAAPSLLERLNPEVSLDETLAAGTDLLVPDVRRQDRGAAERLVVSDGGRYVHALDAQGRIRYHFPATLGSDYDPSPSDTLAIEAVAPNPNWYYQPDLIEGSPEDDEAVMVPPGPNNAVGTVWMSLSKEHFGIHGTAHPGTIGYASSAGCVRLTNWDAEFLSERVEEGVPVAFRDAKSGRTASNP